MSQQEKYEKWIRKVETPSTVKLTRTREVSDVNNEWLKKMLISTYSSRCSVSNLIGTLTNAVTTHQRKTFIISKKVMDELIKNDPNTKNICCKSSTYREFMQKCLSDRTIVILRKQVGRKAGLYKIECEMISDILNKLQGDDYYNAQEAVSLEFHDNGDSLGNRLDDFSIDEINDLAKKGDLAKAIK